jgi:probable rRNA maturation factor
MKPVEGNIQFHLQSKKYSLSQKKRIVSWINLCAVNESVIIGDINIIFCTAAKLLKINQLHLNHRDHTDIITFDHTIGNIISGDLFISIERVRANAVELGIPFSEEILRVIIHGVLHLIGYKDKSAASRREMRAKEDQCLSLYHQKFHVKH